MTAAELTRPLLWAGATHLAMWTVGSWVRGTILGNASRDDDPARRAFQSAMLGFAILGAIAFALGVAHLLYVPLLAAAVAVAAVLGLIRLVRERRWVWRVPTLSHVPLIAGIAFAVAHVPRALDPFLEFDDNVYHLLLPKLYLAAHALTPLPWCLFANMPHLVDLSYVFPVALGGFTAAKVFVLGFTAWILVGLAPFGRAMLGPIGPGLFAVLYLAGPVVQWHLGLAYVEPVLGALLLCGLLSFWRYCEDGESGELLVLAIMAGAACASKYTVWPYTAVSFAIAVLFRPTRGRRIKIVVLASMIALSALLVVPWLAKNAIVTRNPIYPNAYRVFGGKYWSEIQSVQLQHELGFGRGAEKDVSAYVKLPLRVVMGSPTDNTLGVTGISASVMVLLLASMAFPWRRREFRTLVRVLSIAGFVFWCLGSKQTRFLVAFVPVMIVAAGIALVPLRRVRFALPAVTTLVAVAGLFQMKAQPYPATPLVDVFTVSRQELLSRNLCWDLTEFLNRVVPPGGRVLSLWENRLYFLERPFAADDTRGVPTALARLREVGDAHAFAEMIAAEGITHVVVNPYMYQTYMTNGFRFDLIDETIYTAQRLRADKELFERFVATELTEVPWDGAWVVFRLKAAKEPSAP